MLISAVIIKIIRSLFVFTALLCCIAGGAFAQDKEIQNLIEEMNSTEIAFRRDSAMAELVRMGRPAVSFLVAELRVNSGKRRNLSEQVLNMIGGPAVEEVISLLHASDPSNVKSAVAAVAALRIHDGRVVEPLIKLLGHTDRDVRYYAQTALRQIGNNIVRALIPVLKNDDKAVRESAVILLGEKGDNSAVLPLAKILKDNDLSIRLMH